VDRDDTAEGRESEGRESERRGAEGERIHIRGVAATVSLAVLSLASVLGVTALLVGRGPAETVFAAVCAVFPPALIALGATRRGSCDRAVVVTAVALFAVLAAAFLLLFHYRGAGGEAPTVGAVPVPVAILLGGVWLLPLAFVGLVYALTFERHGISGEDLERLRRLAAGRGAAPGGEDRDVDQRPGEAGG